MEMPVNEATILHCTDIHVLMRDEKGMKKKEASKVMSKYMYCTVDIIECKYLCLINSHSG